MIQQKVNADCLTTVLNQDWDKEHFPEPFRLQPNVSFLITYSEYTNYLLSLVKTSDIKLSRRLDLLIDLVTVNSPALYKFYLEDLAFAMAKEVWYAETFKGEGSIILPFSTHGIEHKISNYIKFAGQCSKYGDVLRSRLQAANFIGFKTENAHNSNLFKAATVLMYYAVEVPLVKEINLVYDL